MNAAPCPDSDDAVSVPPCDSAIPRLTDRPRPVPPVTRFVVKNGSKMRSSTIGRDAGPVVADDRDHVTAVPVDLDAHACRRSASPAARSRSG